MLTPHPMATSSILVRPNFQPVGSMMLNKMIYDKGEAGLPGGERDHQRGYARHQYGQGQEHPQDHRLVADPDDDGGARRGSPRSCRLSARRAVAPVPRALDRRTERVPSTTQNPCSTAAISTTATASASPTAPRRALRNHTERNEKCEVSLRQNTGRGISFPGPSRLSPTAWAPAASSAASATISVAMPRDRDRKVGSKEGLNPRCRSGTPSSPSPLAATA